MKQHLTPLIAAGMIAGGSALASLPVAAQTPPEDEIAITHPFTVEVMPDAQMIHFEGIGPHLQLEAHAELLGISADDLLVRLAQGKKLPDILKELGVSPEQLKTKMEERRQARLNDLKTRLNNLVSAGKITQEQADALVEKTNHPADKVFFKRAFKGMPGSPGMNVIKFEKDGEWTKISE